MPFKAKDATTLETILSIDPDLDWATLKSEVKAGRDLRMACCDAPAQLKNSKLGLRFFAHKKGGECSTAPETVEHLRLKEIAVRAIRNSGWEVDVEVAGTTPGGRDWQADVLAWKGNAKVAIEIQWSQQTNETLADRQERYREAGIRGLWLIRHPGFPITESIPAAVVLKTDDEFYACIPDSKHVDRRQKKDPRDSGWHQALLVEDFISAAFSRRFSWGARANAPARASLKGYSSSCWKCNKFTVKIDSIDLDVEGLHRSLSLSAFENDEVLFHQTFPPETLRPHSVGSIRKRYSKTMGTSYLSNGCARCDVLQGKMADFFSHEHRRIREIAAAQVVLDARWQAIVEGRDKHWHIAGAQRLKPVSRPAPSPAASKSAVEPKASNFVPATTTAPGVTPMIDTRPTPPAAPDPEAIETRPRSITMSEIEAAIRVDRGLCRARLDAWGVPWPPTKGWEERLVEAGLPSATDHSKAR